MCAGLCERAGMNPCMHACIKTQVSTQAQTNRSNACNVDVTGRVIPTLLRAVRAAGVPWC